MISTEQKTQFNEILEELGKNLDITEAQFNAAVKSYEAVGLHLAKHDSSLGKYNPEILPQGSFMLGTMIRPIHDDDDLDIDLVCQLVGKPSSWTQFDLKQAVGEQLKSHAKYGKMIKRPEGRRCWTLIYSDSANYHLDILPSIVDSGYRILLEKAFSVDSETETNELALRITDNEEDNYKTEEDHLKWFKSNPFGYARWFFQQASLDMRKAELLNEAIRPIPVYKKEKLPLQRMVQILKRHRDLMFDGDENKPISIIITTLAAQVYEKEQNVLDALTDAVEKMSGIIRERYSIKHNKVIKWIENPVNPEENFADKWADYPEREKNFYKWIAQVQKDIFETTSQVGIHRIQESLEKSLGKNLVRKTFSEIGDKARKLTELGENRIGVKSGISSLGIGVIKPHSFYGE